MPVRVPPPQPSCVAGLISFRPRDSAVGKVICRMGRRAERCSHRSEREGGREGGGQHDTLKRSVLTLFDTLSTRPTRLEGKDDVPCGVQPVAYFTCAEFARC